VLKRGNSTKGNNTSEWHKDIFPAEEGLIRHQRSVPIGRNKKSPITRKEVPARVPQEKQSNPWRK